MLDRRELSIDRFDGVPKYRLQFLRLAPPRVAHVYLVVVAAHPVSLFLDELVEAADGWAFLAVWSNVEHLGAEPLVEVLQFYLIYLGATLFPYVRPYLPDHILGDEVRLPDHALPPP